MPVSPCVAYPGGQPQQHPSPSFISTVAALTAAGTFRRGSGRSHVRHFPLVCWLLSSERDHSLLNRSLPAGAGPETTAGSIQHLPTYPSKSSSPLTNEAARPGPHHLIKPGSQARGAYLAPLEGRRRGEGMECSLLGHGFVPSHPLAEADEPRAILRTCSPLFHRPYSHRCRGLLAWGSRNP